jgi:hypothetical protein
MHPNWLRGLRDQVHAAGVKDRKTASAVNRSFCSAATQTPIPLEPRFAVYLFLWLADESRSRRQQ